MERPGSAVPLTRQARRTELAAGCSFSRWNLICMRHWRLDRRGPWIKKPIPKPWSYSRNKQRSRRESNSLASRNEDYY